jgi:hypothetical protein
MRDSLKNKTTTYTLAFFSMVCMLKAGSSFGQDIVVSEINYHGDSTIDAGSWVEIYNRGGSAVDITNWVFSDDDPSHFFIIPSKMLNPGEYAVLVQDQLLFNSFYPGLSNVLPGSFVFGLSNKSDQLRLFDSQNNLQFSMTYIDSLEWPKGADGNGRTLEVKNFFGNFSDPFNWHDGCMMGSPGGPHVPCNESVIFSEVNYHSSNNLDVGDWVEIRNITGSSIDISNWIFKDKNDTSAYIIPSGTILPAGANRVIAAELSKFNVEFPTVNAMGPFSFGFDNSKEVIRLFNSSGVLQYSMQYRDYYPWPADADGGGYTLEIGDINGFVNDGSNWNIGCYGGSPGTNYNAGCLVGINDLSLEAVSSTVYPNPVSKESIIKINSDKLLKNIFVELYNVLGEKIGKLDDAIITSNGGYFKINTFNFRSGIYFYKIFCEDKSIHSGKFIVEAD